MSKHHKETNKKEDAALTAQPEAMEDGLPVPAPEAAPKEAEPGSRPSDLDVAKAEAEAAAREVESLKAELAELNDKYLRKLADDVNFRKRMLKEKDEAQKYAVSSLLQDLIPILDDFDRGIASAEQTKNYEQVHEGILLIRRQLSQMLENKYALKRLDSKGKPFDPTMHEALFAEPADVEEPVVSEEYLCGYALHDRVLRAAKVRVRIPAPKGASAPATEAKA
ncbi:MAG TPA: nucleotide exchange factor GrpE [Rectinemataceae bacterium]